MLRLISSPLRNSSQDEKPISKPTDGPTCAASEELHEVWKCLTFKGMNTESRCKVVKRHKAQASPVAKQNENFDNQIQTNPVTVRQNNCLSNTKETHEREKICFKIVPIRLKGPFQEVQTYAFMDSSSDATKCLESLLDEVGVESGSVTFDYNVQTISGCKEVSDREATLHICSLDGKANFRLEKVLSTDSAPVEEDNLTSSSELSRWPHLAEVDLEYVSCGKVTMLIGMDHPKLCSANLISRLKR